MKLFQFILLFKKWKSVIIQFFIFFGFIFIAFVVNKVQDNFFIAGGDFYQILDPAAHLHRYFYAWINQAGGQGAFNTLSISFPYYGIQTLFSYFGFGSGINASFLILFLLYLSYLSFFFSVKVIFSDIRKDIRIGGSLLYAFNNFTFSLLIYPWGFTHHILFYIFIPPLISLFIKIFSRNEFIFKDIVLFDLFFILSTISYNNIAFFVVLLMFQFLIFLILIFLTRLKFNFSLVKKIFAVLSIYFLGIVYFILPFYISNISFQNKIIKSASFGGNVFNTIMGNSNSVLNIFQFILNNGFNNQFNFLGLFYIIIVSYLLFKCINNNKINLNIIIFIVLFLLSIVLAGRLKEPFISINLFLFSIPFYQLFRSPDKIFIVLPFFYSMLLVGFLHHIKFKKISIFLLFLILLSIPYKIYNGDIITVLQNPSTKLSNENYSYIVKIPDEYYGVRDIINKVDSSQSIISLPYSVVNSLNWSNYPKWHLVGHDPLHLLYNKNYFSANTFDHPALESNLSFKKFNENMGSPDELLYLIQKFSGQYVFFHKDITLNWVIASSYIKNSLDELKRTSQLDLLVSNDYFDLYELRKEYLVPIINSKAFGFFKKINPSKYRIVLNLKQSESIIFNQSYNLQWLLFPTRYSSHSSCDFVEDATSGVPSLSQFNRVKECSGEEIFFEGEELFYLLKKPIFNDTHTIVNDYANQWTIDPEYIKQNYPNSYKQNQDGSIDVELTLYFKPQSYFYLGLVIFGTTLVGCVGYLIWHFIIKKRVKTAHTFEN